MTEVNCVPNTFYAQNLNNGRSCTDSSQCVSRNCNNGICQGLELGEYCTQHADCHAGLYCQPQKPWPYQSICALANNNYAECTSDYECLPSAYCWYVQLSDAQG